MSIPTKHIPLIAATTLTALSGSAIAANQVIDDTVPVEMVTILIHMPDGRVIETQERRYPSRSLVYIKTGKIPAFKSIGSASADTVSAESEPSESIITELSDDEILELDSEQGEAIPASSKNDTGLESESDPPASEAGHSEPMPGDSSRTYTKTSKS